MDVNDNHDGNDDFLAFSRKRLALFFLSLVVQKCNFLCLGKARSKSTNDDQCIAHME